MKGADLIFPLRGRSAAGAEGASHRRYTFPADNLTASH